jgi:hypothetical protein
MNIFKNVPKLFILPIIISILAYVLLFIYLVFILHLRASSKILPLFVLYAITQIAQLWLIAFIYKKYAGKFKRKNAFRVTRDNLTITSAFTVLCFSAVIILLIVGTNMGWVVYFSFMGLIGLAFIIDYFYKLKGHWRKRVFGNPRPKK